MQKCRCLIVWGIDFTHGFTVIWLIIFFIIILISSVLAYRSMKDYEEIPDNLSLNSVFYIGNPENFTIEILKKMHSLFLSRKQFFSIEKLYKGAEKAITIFGSRELVSFLPELNLIELEDYLVGELPVYLGRQEQNSEVDANRTITWLIEPKNNPKRQIHPGPELKDLSIGDNQKVFLQAVCMPEKDNADAVFQTTWRLMVSDKDSIERVILAKKVDRIFTQQTGLNKHDDDFPELKKFESFKNRSLVPKESANFPMSAREIFDILAN